VAHWSTNYDERVIHIVNKGRKDTLITLGMRSGTEIQSKVP